MTIVFPINGIGQRFSKAGYLDLKPLLLVKGKPLLEHVLQHYPDDPRIHYVFAAHNSIFRHIVGIAPLNSTVIRLSKNGKPLLTAGPVETLLSNNVLEEIDKPGELLIADCDSFMENRQELLDALQSFRKSGATGGVTIRRTKDPWASFANVVDGWVTETREKDPFTEYSTTGPYWWRSGLDFVKAARFSIHAKSYYVSPCYNAHIKWGGSVKAHEVKTFTHLGTPESYESYTHSHSSGTNL